MLLTDFKAVTEIDNKIDMLHKKLGDLYQLRANYALETNKTAKSKSSARSQGKLDSWNKRAGSSASWADQQYKLLTESWASCNIEIPSFKTLKTRLLKARDMIRELEAEQPGLVGYFSVLLVPPSRLLDMPNNHGLRDSQGFLYAADYVDPELRFSSSAAAWQVMVAFAAPESLLLGTPEEIISNKTYKIAGYDTRGLGILEYKALSLQTPSRLDDNSWTMLLKNYRPSSGEPLPSVACLNGQYRFEADDSAGLLGEEGFRPAVRVKA